jgi:hypothetical protein
MTMHSYCLTVGTKSYVRLIRQLSASSQLDVLAISKRSLNRMPMRKAHLRKGNLSKKIFASLDDQEPRIHAITTHPMTAAGVLIFVSFLINCMNTCSFANV